MKTFLVIAAVLGVSSSAALADCAGHVTASAKVDTEFTTASIVAPATEKGGQDAVIPKRQRDEGQTTVTE